MTQLEEFRALGLSDDMLAAIRTKGFETPSPIQKLVIPELLDSQKSNDMIAQAQTGTGKTAAFGLPLLERIHPEKGGSVQGLILVPTRELALQVSEELLSFNAKRRLSITSIYGGASLSEQLRRLKKGVDIVVGTPGRILDHLRRGTLHLENLKFLVLDEADEMLNMGFIEDIEEILACTNEDRRILLFSATMPERIVWLSKKYMRDTQMIRVPTQEVTTDLTDQIYFEVRDSDKFDALTRIIDVEPEFYGIVFCRTKIGVDEVANRLIERGYAAEGLHGDVSQAQREKILKRFKKKSVNILVATDVAARGIDINNLTHVINYSLPQDTESYVHRIGRTARAGADGTAISFCAPEEREYLAGIEKLNRKKIPVVSGHPWDTVQQEQPVKESRAVQPAKPVKVRPVQPPVSKKEEDIMEETKKTAPRANEGGEKRSRSRHGRRDGSRSRQPGQGGQPQQPKFDPHFLTGAETAVLPAKAVAGAGEAPRSAAQPAQPSRPAKGGQNGGRPQRQQAEGKKEEGRSQRNASKGGENRSQEQRQPKGGQKAGAKNQPAEHSRSGSRGSGSRSQSAGPSRSRRSGGRDSRSEDPGLVLISRRPPQQKFSNFEEYMEAHGGATAPIEDHSEEY